MIFNIAKYHSEDFEHYVITTGGDDINKFESASIPVTALKYSYLKLVSHVKIILKILNFCYKNKINIIHSHHRYFDFIAYIISMFIDVKTITTVHSKVGGKGRFSYKSPKIIAVSTSIKDHLMKNFGLAETRIAVIKNFVAANLTGSGENNIFSKVKLGIQENTKVLGFIGRFDKEKGVDVLLKAYQLLQCKFDLLCLLLIGNGKELDYYEKIIKENSLMVKIIKPTDNIESLYHLMDIVILPSRVDPFPLVMLEAGLFGKIFIGARVDGIAEFIKDGYDGLLFEPENYLDLKNKISKALSGEYDTLELGANLKKKVLNNYTLEKNISRYEDIYKKLTFEN